jgi:hypothetical protein
MQRINVYCWNILIAIDQLINTFFGGDPDETLSSRMGKWARTGKNNKGTRKRVYKISNFIVELFEKDHFSKSVEEDEGNRRTIE